MKKLIPSLLLLTCLSPLLPMARADSPIKTHMLWKGGDGSIALWNVAADGTYLSQTHYGPFQGWAASGLSESSDGLVHLLWTQTATGAVAMWNLSTEGTYVSQTQFGPFGGWNAAAMSGPILSTIGPAGPRGPAGPQGPAGPAGSSTLTGPAGGDLTGTYPNPTIAANVINSTKLASDPSSLSKVSGGSITVSNGDIAIGSGKYTGFSPSDAFSYEGLTMGNYALGWFGDSDYADGPWAWLSGWGGIKFFTNRNPRLTITHDGNVGIGTTSPQTTLDVNGGITGGNFVSHGNDFVLNGRGGGVGNNGGNGRAFVDAGASDGLYINYSNDFGNVTVGSGMHVLGSVIANSLQLTGGSDLAEPYKIAASADTKPLPGMVVAIDPQQTGQMRVCTHAYDNTVGGIISGANGIQPGVVLRQAGTVADGTLPIASIGRVWCFCDADAGGPITPGDLLTTSDTPGHAMRVRDYGKAQGAVLGKAMSPLKSGKGLVLVLVTLQ